MAILDKLRTCVEKVDSIQSRFRESLITGQPHPMFRRRDPARKPEAEHGFSLPEEQREARSSSS